MQEAAFCRCGLHNQLQVVTERVVVVFSTWYVWESRHIIVNSRVSVLTITQLPSGMSTLCDKVAYSLIAVLQISEMAFLSFLNKEVTHSCLCLKPYTGLRRLQNVEAVPTL